MSRNFLLFTRVAVLGLALLPWLSQRGNAQALQVGDFVPEFEVLDDQGEVWKLRDQLGKRVLIVYFYPSDFSFCCTRQAERYRDAQPDLASVDADVVGISCDSLESHQIFKTAHALNFPLLADRDGDVARQFGVPLRAGGKAMPHDAAGKPVITSEGETQQFSREWTAARWTFVIGKDGRILRRDTQVSPVSDHKSIAEFICNLTAN